MPEPRQPAPDRPGSASARPVPPGPAPDQPGSASARPVPPGPAPDRLEAGVRGLLAEALDVDPGRMAALPARTRLFDELGMDSLTGARLLDAVRDRYGVDIAADDLNLDSLETIGSLAGFVRDRARTG